MDPQTEIIKAGSVESYAHIYRADLNPEEPVIVVMAPLRNASRPLTLHVHDIATEVVLLGLVPDRDRVIWIEYQPEIEGLVNESWDIVTFSWRMEPSGDETALGSYWLVITRDAADVLCGGDAVVVD